MTTSVTAARNEAYEWEEEWKMRKNKTHLVVWMIIGMIVVVVMMIEMIIMVGMMIGMIVVVWMMIGMIVVLMMMRRLESFLPASKASMILAAWLRTPLLKR